MLGEGQALALRFAVAFFDIRSARACPSRTLPGPLSCRARVSALDPFAIRRSRTTGDCGALTVGQDRLILTPVRERVLANAKNAPILKILTILDILLQTKECGGQAPALRWRWRFLVS